MASGVADLGRRVLRRLDALATRRVILILGWSLFLVYAFPGYMSADSIDQLAQARTGPLHDWYPPMMALLWRYADRIIAGPFPMLVIQSVTFLLGLDRILRHAIRPRTAAIVACCVLLVPPVLTPMGVIWKDSQMAGFFVAGIACLLSTRRGWKVVGCVFLFLATAQRYNAAAGTLPIVLGLFVWRAELGRLRRYAIASGVFVAITAAAFGANRLLTEKKMYAWHGSVALLDIAGTIRYAPDLDDAEVRALLGAMPVVPAGHLQARIHKAYSPREWWPLANGDTHVFTAPKTDEDREAIASAWREVVSSHPKAYFFHRLRVARELLGMSSAKVGALWGEFAESPEEAALIGQAATHSKLQSAWLSLIPELEDSILYRPWAYFVLAIALLPLCRKQRLAFVLFTSGLANELSLFVMAPSADYRYSHWMVVCTITGAILVFATRWRAARVSS